MKEAIVTTMRHTRALGIRCTVLCSLTLLAAPAANECGSTTTTYMPCDVDTVVGSKCRTCHGTTLQFGAPMPLVTYADTQAPAPSNPSLKVWQVMKTYVNLPATDVHHMPPTFMPQLTSAELTTLNNWFNANAPAGGTTQCGGTGGTGGGDVGPEYLPCTPTRTFRAHAAGSTAKYPVPNPTDNKYVCFNFKSPFAAGEQAIAWAPITDDSRVIHHWILYGTNSTLTDGSVTTCSGGGATGATHVTGWAPGGQNSVMDPDVGLNLDYPYFSLQIHYNNFAFNDAADSSGVTFCTTTTPRPNVAGIVMLGNAFFSIPPGANDYPVAAQCSALSNNNSTITVIGASPHMHLLGTGFRTQHFRGFTDMGDLSYVPMGTWSFEAQRHHAVSPRRQVAPGDVLRTTCYFDNPNSFSVGFGPETEDEMCFDFITVYPYSAAKKTCFF